MLKVLVDYPAHDEELTVVARSLEAAPELQQVLSLDELIELQQQAAEVYVDPALISWTVDVATATRRPAEHGLGEIADFVSFGASPRGPITLVAAARALALLRGRDYVVAADLDALVRDAFRHRLVLSYRALAEEVAPDAILDQVLEAVPAPADRSRPRARRGVSESTRSRRARTPEPARARAALAGVAARARAGDRPPGRRPAGRRLPLGVRGRRQRALAGAAVRAGRRRAPDRLERDRPHRRAARARRARRARARHLARARRLRLDGVRHGRPAQGRRRRGRRDRRRLRRDPPRQPARPRRVRRRAASSSGRGRAGARSLDTLRAAARHAAGRHGTLGEALELTDRLARQRSLVVVVSDFRGPLDWRPPLLRLAGRHAVARGRDPRSARAGAGRRRRAAARRSGDRPAAARRHGRPARCASGSPPPPPRSAATLVRAALASAGVRHVALSTEGDWLRPLAGFLRRSGRT